MFKTNVGTADRAIRVIAGLIALSLFFVFPDSSWRWLALIGAVPLLTGLFATCPAYSLFGLSTCPAKRA